MTASLNHLWHRILIYVDGTPYQYTVTEEVVSLGRGDGNQIQILHPAVSNCHLVWKRRENGSYQITDVGSHQSSFPAFLHKPDRNGAPQKRPRKARPSREKIIGTVW